MIKVIALQRELRITHKRLLALARAAGVTLVPKIIATHVNYDTYLHPAKYKFADISFDDAKAIIRQHYLELGRKEGLDK